MKRHHFFVMIATKMKRYYLRCLTYFNMLD
jgi:hypothetical protein